MVHAAPTLWGYTGLINIPTADLMPEGVRLLREGGGMPALVVGLHDLPKQVREWGVTPEGGQFQSPSNCAVCAQSLDYLDL